MANCFSFDVAKRDINQLETFRINWLNFARPFPIIRFQLIFLKRNELLRGHSNADMCDRKYFDLLHFAFALEPNFQQLVQFFFLALSMLLFLLALFTLLIWNRTNFLNFFSFAFMANHHRWLWFRSNFFSLLLFVFFSLLFIYLYLVWDRDAQDFVCCFEKRPCKLPGAGRKRERAASKMNETAKGERTKMHFWEKEKT